MKILEWIRILRKKYWAFNHRVPTKLYISSRRLIQLKKELMYSGWGFHRIMNNKMLGMEIIKTSFNYEFVEE